MHSKPIRTLFHPPVKVFRYPCRKDGEEERVEEREEEREVKKGNKRGRRGKGERQFYKRRFEKIKMQLETPK